MLSEKRIDALMKKIIDHTKYMLVLRCTLHNYNIIKKYLDNKYYDDGFISCRLYKKYIYVFSFCNKNSKLYRNILIYDLIKDQNEPLLYIRMKLNGKSDEAIKKRYIKEKMEDKYEHDKLTFDIYVEHNYI